MAEQNQDAAKEQAVSITVQARGAIVWLIVNGRPLVGMPAENTRTLAAGMFVAAALVDGAVRPPVQQGVCALCGCTVATPCSTQCKGVAEDSETGLCRACIAKAIVGHTLTEAGG